MGRCSHAVLTCLTAFDASRNGYYEAALCSAINDWLRAEWLERDDRLRAYLTIPTLDPDLAIQEVERVGDHDGFVGVLVPIRSETRWGNRRYHDLHEAIAAKDLVLALHAWGRAGSAATGSGFTHTYFEDYLANSQIVAQAQLLSLVSEGVFERVPSLRVVLLEAGFSWLPPLLWRFDKDWKASGARCPGSRTGRRSTSSATSAPRPRRPSCRPIREQAAQLAEMLGASDMLVFASDFPHEHGDGNLDTLLEVLDDAGREAVLRGNAAALYGLAG